MHQRQSGIGAGQGGHHEQRGNDQNGGFHGFPPKAIVETTCLILAWFCYKIVNRVVKIPQLGVGRWIVGFPPRAPAFSYYHVLYGFAHGMFLIAFVVHSGHIVALGIRFIANSALAGTLPAREQCSLIRMERVSFTRNNCGIRKCFRSGFGPYRINDSAMVMFLYYVNTAFMWRVSGRGVAPPGRIYESGALT